MVLSEANKVEGDDEQRRNQFKQELFQNYGQDLDNTNRFQEIKIDVLSEAQDHRQSRHDAQSHNKRVLSGNDHLHNRQEGQIVVLPKRKVRPSNHCL